MLLCIWKHKAFLRLNIPIPLPKIYLPPSLPCIKCIYLAALYKFIIPGLLLHSMISEKPSTKHIVYTPVQDAQPQHSLTPNIKVPFASPTSIETPITKHSENSAKMNSKVNNSGPTITMQSLPRSHSKGRSSKAQKFTHMFNALEDWWIFETLCYIWALCNLFAIIITLVIHQERSVPNWPYAISINSVISIFTALLKTALMVIVAAGKS